MRDAGQHRRALLDRTLDARLHLDEGGGRAADFAGTAGTEVGHFPPLAETFGRIGKPQDRFDLIAQKNNCDGQQHCRCAHHPEQEDFRIGDIGRAAPGKDPHHGVVELDADFQQRGLADRIHPKRTPDLLAQFLRQRLIQQ